MKKVGNKNLTPATFRTLLPLQERAAERGISRHARETPDSDNQSLLHQSQDWPRILEANIPFDLPVLHQIPLETITRRMVLTPHWLHSVNMRWPRGPMDTETAFSGKQVHSEGFTAREWGVGVVQAAGTNEHKKVLKRFSEKNSHQFPEVRNYSAKQSRQNLLWSCPLNHARHRDEHPDEPTRSGHTS